MSSLEIARKARGREPATSPNPPTFIKGSASAARKRTLIVWDMRAIVHQNTPPVGRALKSNFSKLGVWLSPIKVSRHGKSQEEIVSFGNQSHDFGL
jgi:hypothetical protein